MPIGDQKPPPIRMDLEMIPQYYRGELAWLAKDPVSLNYFRLGEVEYVVLRCFQRGLGVDETIKEVKTRTGAEVPATEIFRFASQLRSSNLIKSRGMEDVARLTSNRRAAKKAKVKKVVSNYLFITIPLWDPDRALNRLIPYFRWLMNIGSLVVWLIVTSIAVWIMGNNFQTIIGETFSLLSKDRLLILSIVVFSVKFVHEMGHALVCKYYGGEVHAIGPAFLIFQPCMYTDTTDAWLFPNKWHRVLVTAAGIFIEIFLASIAAIVWITTDPGLVKQIAYTTMMVCSISTILFNANPLLRFDGYYVLSDMMEIPNLRAKTTQYMNYLFDRYILGVGDRRPDVEEDATDVFLIYGILRFMYRLVLVISIGFILYAIFPPLGIFMWLSTAYGMIIGPTIARGKKLTRQYRGGNARLRYIFIVAGIIAAVVTMWFIPVDYTLNAPCEVVGPQGPHKTIIKTTEPGRVKHVHVRDGDIVKEGDILITLESPMLDLSIERLEADLEIARRNLRAVRAASDDVRGQSLVQQWEKEIAVFVDQIKVAEQRRKDLVLTAPCDGVIVPVHRFESRGMTSGHGFVSPSIREGINLIDATDMTVPKGTGLVAIGRTSHIRIDMYVVEYNEELIQDGTVAARTSHIKEGKDGSPVKIKLRAWPDKLIETHVKRVPDNESIGVPNVALTLLGQGTIAVKPPKEGVELEPLQALYVVESEPLDAETQKELTEAFGAYWGLTGKAKIVYGRGPLGTYYFNRIRRGLKLRMQQANKPG